MPYIPPIPPTTTGQALGFPITATSSGAMVVAGTTFDPSQPLANIAIQLSTIASALNGGQGGTVETKIPGGLLNTLNSSAKSLANIDGALQVMITGGKEAVGSQFSAAHSIQSSLSTIASLMTTMISLQSLATADQMNHNLFTQQTTNQGREEALLKPIEVKPEAFTKQTQGAFAKIATINSQTSASGLLLEISTNALKSGADITKDLIAGTQIGQTFIGWGKDVKAYVATQQDAIKAKAKETEAELERKKLAAAGGSN